MVSTFKNHFPLVICLFLFHGDPFYRLFPRVVFLFQDRKLRTDSCAAEGEDGSSKLNLTLLSRQILFVFNDRNVTISGVLCLL